MKQLLLIPILCCMNLDAAEDFPLLKKQLDEEITKHEIVGGLVQTGNRDGVMRQEMSGLADMETNRAIQADDLFWIASMTKPITGTAVMMLHERGKLNIHNPVAKYLPEFADLKDAQGKHMIITIAQCMQHSSGLSDVPRGADADFENLADLTKHVVTLPVNFPPDQKWSYCQSGINTAARVVEVVSGKSFEAFVAEELFQPLGMKDTTFSPSAEQMKRLCKAYQKSSVTEWKKASLNFLLGEPGANKKRYPRANGGLFSTAADYGRFARMILRGGELDGRRYLNEETVREMTRVHTGDLATGFTPGNGWGIGWCVIRKPQGVTAILSPGSHGHGGAFGTQCWIDPVKQRYFLFLVQRSDFANADGSATRQSLQEKAFAP
jgi:CubicO group peptidase (beta-lactamase class C family)